jgi:hypothetical protein
LIEVVRGQLLMREMEGVILLIWVDVRGQERKRRIRTASCLSMRHVPTGRLSRLLLLCWLRILMVRLHEWAGLWRVVILREFGLLDCVVVRGQLLMREMEGVILLIWVDVRGQERRRRTNTAGCLFIEHVPTMLLSRLLLLCWLRILMVRLHEWAGLWRVVILREFCTIVCFA